MMRSRQKRHHQRPSVADATEKRPVSGTGQPDGRSRRVGHSLLGADLLWEGLTREGVEVVFGYPGGAIMPAYDRMTAYPIRHVLVRHEQGAAHMADGYARASGNVGVAIATSGPGATNLVTGIANAMLDSVPMVCITGQVPSPLLGSDAFQETDITGVTLPITKHNYLVTHATEVLPTIREAFHVARSGRPGPVLVDITKDAQLGSAHLEDEKPSATLPGYCPAPKLIQEDIERAAFMIQAARRPVILAGHGVVKADAYRLLRELVQRTEIPVAVTLLGLGILEGNDPHLLGMMGMHGEAWVNKTIQEADLFIALGMRFDDRVTGTVATYGLEAKKIHVELDPSEVNKNVKVDLSIVGDVGEVLRTLTPLVQKSDRRAWQARIEILRQDGLARDITRQADDGQLYAARVIDELFCVTGGKALVVSDVGQNQMWAAQYYRPYRPRFMLTSGGLGTMGFALPAAIGAALANKRVEVWVIAGDGGFQMTAAELSTCAQEGLRLRIAIINNGYLGMVRQWQEFFFERRYVATPIGSPDFVTLAAAHGLMGVRVEHPNEVSDAIAAARQHPGTCLIDFRVEPEDSVYPMVPAGAALHDMIRRPDGQDATPA